MLARLAGVAHEVSADVGAELGQQDGCGMSD
jgi:hypothetical protein